MASALSETTQIDTKRYPRYRFVIGGLILAAHLSLGVNFFSVSPLLPLAIEEYGISRATASLLLAVPTLAKAFMGLPGSIIISRFGLKRIFTLSWFMMGTLIFSSLAPNFLSLLLLRLIYGIGGGLMMPAIGPLVMQWFKPKEIPIMNSLNLIVMSLGIAVSVFVAAPLANTFAWQAVLGLFGGIALLGAVAWWFLGETNSDAQNAEPRFTMQDIKSVLGHRTIFLIVVGDALVFVLYAALTGWLPTFFHEFRGMTLVEAGNITGLLPFVGMFSVVIGGYLTLKVKSRRLFFVIPGILVAVGGFGSFLFESEVLIVTAVLLFGIGTWIYQPILLTLPMQLPWMTPNKVAIVWGASLTIAGFGMFISPIVVGASRDLFGTFVPGFSIWAVLACALFFAGLLLPENDLKAPA